MKDLFCEDGCLTDFAFKALAGGYPLDELERLEIAEHLSFCDLCVERYAEALADLPLLSPEKPAIPAVKRRLRERARRLFINRYTTVVAAASIAIFCFTPETIDSMRVRLDNSGRLLDQVNQSISSIGGRASSFTEHIADSISHFCDQFTFERSSTNHEEE